MAGLASHAVPHRHQLNLSAPRRLKIDPAHAVQVGDGFIENGHSKAFEGSQTAINIGGTQSHMAGPGIVAMGLGLIDSAPWY